MSQESPATPDSLETTESCVLIPSLKTRGLLDFPDELLYRVASDVAPNGGRRAGSLRLTCRQLDSAVAPVVWVSIHLLPDVGAQGTLLVFLVRDRRGRAGSVKSVRYDLPPPPLPGGNIDLNASLLANNLPRLERLHVVGGNGAMPAGSTRRTSAPPPRPPAPPKTSPPTSPSSSPFLGS